MTLSSEATPAVDPAGLPADPSAYRKRGAGARAWAFGLAIVIWTGLAIWAGAFLTGRLAPGAVAPGDSGGALNIPFVTRPPVTSAVPVAPETEVASPDAGSPALAARVERLETDQRRSSEAAAAALAAAVLMDASQSAAPFDADLAAISHLLPASVDLAALQQLAREGAPTRAALAAEFSRSAARVATAARTPPEGAGLLQRLGHALSGVVTIRRVGGASGSGADAILNRAQRALESGDLETAAAELDQLPGPAQQAMRGWRERAQRRLAIDGQVAVIRAAAMRDLARSAGAPS